MLSKNLWIGVVRVEIKFLKKEPDYVEVLLEGGDEGLANYIVEKVLDLSFKFG